MKDKIGISIFFVISLICVLNGLSKVKAESMQLSIIVSSVILLALLFRWFRQDTINRGYVDLLDRGMFLLTAGHIVLPLYLLWTRRLKGFLILLLALLCLLVPATIILFVFR